jgi:hypothetical protein
MVFWVVGKNGAFVWKTTWQHVPASHARCKGPGQMCGSRSYCWRGEDSYQHLNRDSGAWEADRHRLAPSTAAYETAYDERWGNTTMSRYGAEVDAKLAAVMVLTTRVLEAQKAGRDQARGQK